MLTCEELPLVQPDPVVLEINRLQNQLTERVKEVATCQGEIKALRASGALKDKAIEELREEISKVNDRLRLTEDNLKQKNLEIKKVNEEKKDALAAQFAAEATLRRVYAEQKDDDFVPIESFISPLEAEIKMYKNEITALQEDKKALERLTKSKESALLEAERILRSALERALIVEEVQNENFDLKRQIEICQEENKILEKTNRQKILEVEKLSQTIHELEEVILSSGATANAIRDYKRQISELQEEKRTLDRELARVKVSASRIANVVANEWKDENDKVMPVRQWLEERRILQAEMQRLKEKLAISERTAKAESQLKDKLNLRLKTLEEVLKQWLPNNQSLKTEKSNIFGFLTTNGGLRNKSTPQPKAFTLGSSKKGIWTSRKKVVDTGEKENEMEVSAGMNLSVCIDERETPDIKTNIDLDEDSKVKSSNDMVSGFLYDKLQKIVIQLKKSCEIKDIILQAKDEEIKVLTKKVDALTKAMEVEWKKMKREAAAREKEAALTKSDDNRKNRKVQTPQRVMKEH
ncbi:putative microtubule-associated protein [Lupinus albus]|uniref:Putative microtubule-associated protein n=1 Tax=Lupinus albus TaxID=3870 RepID=A0A6A4P522_LUPAL|nr:putative microtubule-associated protein [Lupinus albus]